MAADGSAKASRPTRFNTREGFSEFSDSLPPKNNLTCLRAGTDSNRTEIEPDSKLSRSQGMQGVIGERFPKPWSAMDGAIRAPQGWVYGRVLESVTRLPQTPLVRGPTQARTKSQTQRPPDREATTTAMTRTAAPRMPQRPRISPRNNHASNATNSGSRVTMMLDRVASVFWMPRKNMR